MIKNKALVFSFLILLPIGAFADAPLLTNNQSIADGCTTTNIGTGSGTVNMVANFTPTQYNCLAGYYLPADGVECSACLSSSICAGGTYTYNASSAQGIASSANGSCVNATLGKASGTVNAVPQFTPNSYTCSSGQYLPANAIACVACLAGASCAGGTYTFNESVDQGISCSGTMYNNACHGACSVLSTLHAGEYSYPLFADKVNVPSPVIHVKKDDTVCYAYMEADVTGNENGFKVRWNNTVYHAIDPR